LKEYGIPLELSEVAREIVDARKRDVQRFLIKQATTISKLHLMDFDYSVRVEEKKLGGIC